MEIDQLFDLPAHALLVHVPIVMVPLALLAALVALVPIARRPTALAAAAFALVGAVGAVLAVGAGEKLQDRVRETDQIEEHTESGEAVELPAIVFAVLAVGGAAVEVGRRRARPDGPGGPARPAGDQLVSDGPGAAPATLRSPLPAWVPVIVLAASAVAGAYTTYTVVEAGHSGSKAVWSGTTTGGSNSGQGGDDGAGDDGGKGGADNGGDDDAYED